MATAEFGTAFPENKRGMALGLVGGVYGIANVFGASAGSAILEIFGQSNWQFIFYVNLPICLFILIAGFIRLPNTKEKDVRPIDGLGILVLTMMSLSLLYGLKNIDFFDLATSIVQVDVFPFLLAFFILIPVFVFVEKRAADPVINLSYFKDRDIVIILILAVISGVVLMGSIFVPQFAENALRLPSGSGGYFVIILGVFAGIGAPISGKLIDRFGVKAVLGFGFAASAVGAVYLAFIATQNPSLLNVVVSLIFLGLGMGFTMGTPINYMMLAKTNDAEANSALATLSLVRSIGTAVAPAIMVAFLAHAGTTIQDRITPILPGEVQISALPYAQELTDQFNALKEDENTKELMADMNMPDLVALQTIEIPTDSRSENYTLSDDLKKLLQKSDATTIVENTKILSTAMFDQMKPSLMAAINDGVDSGISGMTTAYEEMGTSLAAMVEAREQLASGIEGIDSALQQQRSALSQMQEMKPMLQNIENYTSVLDLMPDSVRASLPQQALAILANVKTSADLQAQIGSLQATIGSMTTTLEGLEASYAQTPTENLWQTIVQFRTAINAQQQVLGMMQQYLPTLQKVENYTSVLDLMPDNVRASLPASVLDQLASVRTVSDLEEQIRQLESAIAILENTRNEMIDALAQLDEGSSSLEQARLDIALNIDRMKVLREAVPGAFDEALENYLYAIDERSGTIEETFQRTLNEGFKGMFILVAISAFVGLILLAFYRVEDRS